MASPAGMADALLSEKSEQCLTSDNVIAAWFRTQKLWITKVY